MKKNIIIVTLTGLLVITNKKKIKKLSNEFNNFIKENTDDLKD